jgi:L-threonylcarbamoyladenylate synthase
VNEVEQAVSALRAGKVVVLPTDTVYGLCCAPRDSEAVASINILKGRPAQPLALLGADLEALYACVPELEERWRPPLERLLPGPYTLVLPNPDRRLPWLSPGNEPTIGVRIPELPVTAKEVVERFGAVAATSANRHGEPDPRLIEEIPAEILSAAGAVVDGGELPGVPSTVIDLSGAAPVVKRIGAGDLERALRLVGELEGR